ncbi:MAG: LysR family transcriptional regulator [Clostridium sp.]|nr:LysR family transcriptional regulator [Clostridium sp.]
MGSHDYEYVLAVSQEGSFSRAAQRLYISQPALSAAIKKIENELHGIPLFDRSVSPVALTREGRFWLEKARRIDELENEIDEHFASIANVRSGTINVGSSSYFCAYMLAEIISRYHKANPACEILLTECSTTDLDAGLRDGRIVMGIDVDRLDPDVFDLTELGHEYLILGVPSSFPVTEKLREYELTRAQILDRSFLDDAVRSVDLSLLAEEPFIMMKKKQDSYARAMAICRQAGFVPKVSLYMDQLLTAYNVARNGQSGCVFFRDTILRYTEPTSRLKYYKVASDLAKRSIWLTVRKSPKPSRLAEDFIKYVMLNMKD